LGGKSARSVGFIFAEGSSVMNTLCALEQILVRDYGVTAGQVRSDATLESLGLDSLSMLELMICRPSATSSSSSMGSSRANRNWPAYPRACHEAAPGRGHRPRRGRAAR
jgi:hypothetical protein